MKQKKDHHLTKTLMLSPYACSSLQHFSILYQNKRHLAINCKKLVSNIPQDTRYLSVHAKELRSISNDTSSDCAGIKCWSETVFGMNLRSLSVVLVKGHLHFWNKLVLTGHSRTPETRDLR